MDHCFPSRLQVLEEQSDSGMFPCLSLCQKQLGSHGLGARKKGVCQWQQESVPRSQFPRSFQWLSGIYRMRNNRLCVCVCVCNQVRIIRGEESL